jgi:hypothetical protein
LRKGRGRDGERNQQDDDGRQLREAIGYISHVFQLPLILFCSAVPAQVFCKVYASLFGAHIFILSTEPMPYKQKHLDLKLAAPFRPPKY